MILLIKPILLKFATSDSVKKLIVDLLKKLVSTTDNKVDDKAVEFLEKQLFPEKSHKVPNVCQMPACFSWFLKCFPHLEVHCFPHV